MPSTPDDSTRQDAAKSADLRLRRSPTFFANHFRHASDLVPLRRRHFALPDRNRIQPALVRLGGLAGLGAAAPAPCSRQEDSFMSRKRILILLAAAPCCRHGALCRLVPPRHRSARVRYRRARNIRGGFQSVAALIRFWSAKRHVQAGQVLITFDDRELRARSKNPARR